MSSVRPALKPETPKLVTAWDARTGRTVYRGPDGGWLPQPAGAAVLTGDAAEAALAAAQADEAVILDPYFMEATAEGAIAGREALRETIRTRGPTTRPDLGKQAENA